MSVMICQDEQFDKLLAAHSKVIVKLHANWCGSCRLVAPKYKRLASDERFAGITFVEVDAEANPAIRQQAQVSNLPTFAIFHRGVLVESIATSNETTIVALLEKLQNS